MDEEYFTIEEVRQRLKVTRVTIYAWMASGALPYVVVGKHRRITATALRDFIKPGREDVRTGEGKPEEDRMALRLAAA